MSFIKDNILWIVIIAMSVVLVFSLISHIKDPKEEKTLTTSVQISNIESLDNTKIGWGIKRNSNHEQPDLGNKNKSLLDKYEGIAMGNKDKPYIYLTFDLGYEAGYTSKILEVLKNNNVKATFFITAHYLNTAPELVQKMIDEGHIVGNQFSTLLMDV